MSSSRPGGPYARAFKPVSRAGERLRDKPGGKRSIGAIALEQLHDATGAVGVVEGERLLKARAKDDDVLAGLADRPADRSEVEETAEKPFRSRWRAPVRSSRSRGARR